MTTTARTMPCKQHPTGRTIEVAPERSIVAAPDDTEMPKVGIVSWQKIGPNEYRPVVRIHERWIRLTTDTPEKLGMGINYRTLSRLITAGFIDSRRPSPSCTLFSLESWESHIEACADPEFWERCDEPGTKRTNRERYLSAI